MFLREAIAGTVIGLLGVCCSACAPPPTPEFERAPVPVPAPVSTPSTSPASDAGLTVRVAVQEPNIAPLNSSRPALHLVFTNVSATPLSVFDEWNSWGYFNVKLEYTLSDGTRGHMTKGAGAGRLLSWTMNAPSATTLLPGQCLVWEVYFDPKVWSDVPQVAEDAVGTFTATFAEEGHRAMDGTVVWQGLIRSPPQQVPVRAR